MAKSTFFRIAVEGATIDGREIKREWLEQMARTYDPATYTARINCEHIAGYSPDRPFNAYGSVLALKTEEVELTIGGEKKTLLALYAQIDANDQLVEINKAGQKLFTSCEVRENFAGTTDAYLTGLAVTDNPASLGTEPLKFAALARGNVFTPAHETTIDLAAEPLDSEAIGASFARSLVAFFKKEQPHSPANPPANPPAQSGSGQQPANDNAFDPQAFATTFASAVADQIAAATRPANDAVAALATRFDTLESRLASSEQPQSFTRAPATGGNGTQLTDC